MDYYEELGLERTANVQEIRQAYKLMARLVHPDRQANQRLREMAQRQMQRLNEILSILTNEQARRRYDAELDHTPLEVALLSQGPLPAVRPSSSWRPAWAPAVARHSFWISLALVPLCACLWYFVQDTGSSARTSAGQEAISAAPESAPISASVSKKKLRGPYPIQAPAPKVKDAVTAPRIEPLAATSESAAPEPMTQEQTSVNPAAGLSEHPPDAPEELTFAGNWIYLPDPADSPATGNYPAVYIELILKEDRGLLSGNYRARYRVADRAMSPEISFQLKGVPHTRNAARVRWSSEDGASGEADLTLVAPNALTLSWWTTELARHPALVSGTAKLLRQRATERGGKL